MTKSIKSPKTLPMRTSGTQHLIERTYRESGNFQWAREVLINAMEAGAKRVDFGIEWQAVERKGIYRRVIADDGQGMTAEQLVEFFNVFGGGGKPIGGAHENFGVGSKTSLLPWNRHGMVVVSWVKGEPSMIWVRQDKDTGEYGLRLFRAKAANDEETLEAVVMPFQDSQSGCDWGQVKPSWMKDHGTVIVLLGNSPTEDTVLGDPSRDEADLKGLAAYMNRRLWQMPVGVHVTVDELRHTDRKNWPKSAEEARTGETRTNHRDVRGAEHYVTYPVESFARGRCAHTGTLPLQDGTKVHWYLWEGERPGVHSYASNQGFVAALYKNELYDPTAHLAAYRSFGVTDSSVRQRLWLIVEPVPFKEKTNRGVYPRTDRNTLLLRGGPDAGSPLPYADWGAEFSDNMPDPIREALRAAHQDAGTIDDRRWREQLADRFGDRWRVAKLRLAAAGELTTDANQAGGEPVVKARRTGGSGGDGLPSSDPHHASTGTQGPTVLGVAPGGAPAMKARAGVNIPTYRTARPEELEAGMLAAWAPHDPEHPEGVVLLNTSHPVLEQQVKYWRERYASHHAVEVEREVIDVYGQVAVAKVAHSERLRGILPSETVDKELRSEAALTMALLGLIAEEQLIASRLGARLGRKKTGDHAAVTA
jgi:hypothetical protein